VRTARRWRSADVSLCCHVPDPALADSRRLPLIPEPSTKFPTYTLMTGRMTQFVANVWTSRSAQREGSVETRRYTLIPCQPQTLLEWTFGLRGTMSLAPPSRLNWPSSSLTCEYCKLGGISSTDGLHLVISVGEHAGAVVGGNEGELRTRNYSCSLPAWRRNPARWAPDDSAESPRRRTSAERFPPPVEIPGAGLQSGTRSSDRQPKTA